jgi:hypothetical protein
VSGAAIFALGSVPLGRSTTWRIFAERKIRKLRPAKSVAPLSGPIRPFRRVSPRSRSPPSRRSSPAARLPQSVEHAGHVRLPLDPRHDDVEHLVAEVAKLALDRFEVIDYACPWRFCSRAISAINRPPRRRRPCRGSSAVVSMPWLSSQPSTKSAVVPRTSS